MGLTHKFYHYEIPEGGMCPPWYYGRICIDWRKNGSMWAVIPLNYIIRLGKEINHLWNVMRRGHSFLDEIVAYRSTKDYERLSKHWREYWHDIYKLTNEIVKIDKLIKNLTQNKEA